MARLNDTRALTDSPPREGETHHISTERIDNGYLVRRSTCTDTGEYKSSTRFYKNAPTILPPRAIRNGDGPPGAVGNEGLVDGAEYAGKK